MSAKKNFKEQLQRQLGFLRMSCSAYDNGNHDEAIRIATVIRVLIHDTRHSVSLLNHLNATSIRLLSTCPPLSEVFRSEDLSNPECMIVSFNGVSSIGCDGIKPLLSDAYVDDQLPIKDWWNQTILIIGEGKHIRRRDIVLCAADQDGGAHVDARLNSQYEELISRPQWVMRSVTAPYKLNYEEAVESHYIGLRQMGYELMNSSELLAII